VKHTTLSLVLPCHNEEAVIEKTINAAHAWFVRKNISGEIIIVDNGSTDRTATVLNQLQNKINNLVIVTNGKNMGYGGSILSGCDMARMDYIAFMDSDGQFDVSDFDRLLPHLESVKFVSGIRKYRKDSFGRIVSSFLWNIVVKALLGIRAKDVDCGMKAFHLSIWPQIRPVYGSGNLFSAEMFYRLKKNNIAFKQEIVRHFPRLRGQTGVIQLSALLQTFSQLWALLLDPKHVGDEGANVSY